MAFLIDQDGLIREKDLGDKTAQAPTEVAVYDPSRTEVLTPEANNASTGSSNSR